MSESFTMQDLVALGHLYVSDGYRTKRSEHGRPGIPILRVAEVLDGSISPTFEDYVSDDFRSAMGTKISQPGDIVLTTKGTVGRVAIMPEDSAEFSYSPQVCFFRLDSNGILDRRYLYYWFKSDAFWRQASYRKGQTDMADYINLADIRSLTIVVPPKHDQQAIAAVLGALDDKIALNERIGTLTDELCAAQFSRLIDTSVALKEVPLGTVAEVNARSIKPITGGHLRYIDISSVGVGTMIWPERLSWDSAPGRARRRVAIGDTIWSTVRPNRRSHALVLDDDPELVASTGLATLTPRAVGAAYLYECTKLNKFVSYLESVAEGSAYPAVRADKFNQAPLPMASGEDVQRFERAAYGVRERAHAATQESRTLASLRDTLLPKLMSGQITVRQAESLVEEAT